MKFDAQERLATDHAQLDYCLAIALAGLRDRSDSAYQKLDLFWARLAMHIRAEHLHLFPAVLSICERDQTDLSSIPNTTALLRSDHDLFMHELARLVKMMRSSDARDNMLAEILVRLRKIEALLDEHNMIEEQNIYPLVKRYLTDGEYSGLLSSLQSELSNLPARFRTTSS